MYCTYILYHKGERDIQYYIQYPVRKRVHDIYYIISYMISSHQEILGISSPRAS